MRDGERHCREALGRGVDDDHRVALPGLAGLLAADAAPKIDDFLAMNVRAARPAELVPSRDIRDEGVAYAFEAAADLSVDGHRLPPPDVPVPQRLLQERGKCPATCATEVRHDVPHRVPATAPGADAATSVPVRGSSYNTRNPSRRTASWSSSINT